MKQNLIKLVWAWRILRARHFIVLTNKASMLFIPDKYVGHPSLQDAVSLISQRSLLVEYREAIEKAIKQFDTFKSKAKAKRSK